MRTIEAEFRETPELRSYPLERHEIAVAQEGMAAARRALRVSHVGIRAFDNRHPVCGGLLRPHPAGAVVAAHLLHAARLDILDDLVELGLPHIEDAQVQSAVAAVEAVLLELLAREIQQRHDHRMAASSDSDDALVLDVDVKDVLTANLQQHRCVEHSECHAGQQAIDAFAGIAFQLGQD